MRESEMHGPMPHSPDQTSSFAFSRRRVLAAAIGGAGFFTIGAGLNRGKADVAAQVGAELVQPVVWQSENGLLTGSLSANLDTSRGAGAVAFGAAGTGFGGLLPGPTLRVAPGDRIKLTLENHLGEPTNIHVHGLHVSPLGHSDNVFVHVLAGETWEYEYDLPVDHPTGLFWYHPHHHGHAKDQTEAGLAGAIIIADGLDEPVEVRDAPQQRLLVFQRLNPGPDPNVRYYVNGQSKPVISIAEGEIQLWRIVNASADDFFNLRIAEHPFRRVGIDGNWILNYRSDPEAKVLPLGPAERADILITGKSLQSQESMRTFEVRSLRKSSQANRPFFDEDFVADDASDLLFDIIATLNVTKAASAIATGQGTPLPGTPEAGPAQSVVDLRGHQGVVERKIAFQLDNSTGSLLIDGRSFNADRIDQTVALDAIEEWTIVNETAEAFGWHPFHLHVNDFDVIETSHSGLQEQFYQDTIPLPPSRDPEHPGWVRFRTRFADFTGKFVYHCHILAHEDRGMMGVVEVVHPIEIAGAMFDQPTVTVRARTTLLWTNHDDAVHTVSADAPLFNSGPLANGKSFTFTFDVPGEVAVKLDGGLLGTVTVEETRTIEIAGNAFAPADLQVEKHTTVVWTNRDIEPRAITAADGSFASGLLPHQASFRYTFDTEGTFAYGGDGQPAMQGTITVGATEPSTRASVWIGDTGFDPPQMTVPTGTTVSWTNRASRAHTVTTIDGLLFDSGRLDPEQPFVPGQRFSYTFASPGTIRYSSALSMRGRIVVVDSAPPGDVAVEIDNIGFTPDGREIVRGAAVTWTNRGTGQHNVTIVASDGTTFDSGTLDPGVSFSHTFDAEGIFSYHDALQPSIVGEIVAM